MKVSSDMEDKVFKIDYGNEIESEISKLISQINDTQSVKTVFPHRWLAIKLLESDEEVHLRLMVLQGGAELIKSSRASIEKLEGILGDDVDIFMADRRYGWINGLVKEVVKKPDGSRLSTSDKIDKVVTNRTLGIPIFLFAMWVVFKLTADVSAPYLDWVDGLINGPILRWGLALLGWVGLGGTWVESLFADGIIAGVGGVMVFVPVLMFLYIALAVLEDSGYMARAAFVMDRLMHTLGLHGKSFLPMLVGFGCTVPAMYATRTLENKKDRILTGLLVPFMSCGARLPVYILFATIFFPKNSGLVVFSMYVLGIVVAIVLGVVLKNTLFKDKEQSAFVMELPPYRLPTFRGIWVHTWERTGAFVRKAWTIIMAASIVLWLLMSIPVGGKGTFAKADISDSLFAVTTNAIAPLFRPLGFDSWEASGALLTGFVAKEVVVSTLSQVYSGAESGAVDAEETPTFFEDVGEVISSFAVATFDTLKSIPLIVGINLLGEEVEEQPTALMAQIHQGFTETSNGHGVLAGLAFMIFVLIYTPCMTAIAAEKQELGMKWTWVSIIGQLALAWGLSFLVFQGGILLGLG
ncbi:MAG: ferrous iron transport protein B [Anaerolineaceae bacterium]|nr:ferrous iron transport protein B [Anaerolineaceae bacterium]